MSKVKLEHKDAPTAEIAQRLKAHIENMRAIPSIFELANFEKAERTLRSLIYFFENQHLIKNVLMAGPDRYKLAIRRIPNYMQGDEEIGVLRSPRPTGDKHGVPLASNSRSDYMSVHLNDYIKELLAGEDPKKVAEKAVGTFVDCTMQILSGLDSIPLRAEEAVKRAVAEARGKGPLSDADVEKISLEACQNEVLNILSRFVNLVRDSDHGCLDARIKHAQNYMLRVHFNLPLSFETLDNLDGAITRDDLYSELQRQLGGSSPITPFTHTLNWLSQTRLYSGLSVKEKVEEKGQGSKAPTVYRSITVGPRKLIQLANNFITADGGTVKLLTPEEMIKEFCKFPPSSEPQFQGLTVNLEKFSLKTLEEADALASILEEFLAEHGSMGKLRPEVNGPFFSFWLTAREKTILIKGKKYAPAPSDQEKAFARLELNPVLSVNFQPYSHLPYVFIYRSVTEAVDTCKKVKELLKDLHVAIEGAQTRQWLPGLYMFALTQEQYTILESLSLAKDLDKPADSKAAAPTPAVAPAIPAAAPPVATVPASASSSESSSTQHSVLAALAQAQPAAAAVPKKPSTSGSSDLAAASSLVALAHPQPTAAAAAVPKKPSTNDTSSSSSDSAATSSGSHPAAPHASNPARMLGPKRKAENQGNEPAKRPPRDPGNDGADLGSFLGN